MIAFGFPGHVGPARLHVFVDDRRNLQSCGDVQQCGDKGRVRYSKENENGMFETGISFEGTPEEIVAHKKSYTGQFLKEHLNGDG